MLERGASWLSQRPELPTSVGAVLGHYADTGVFDYRSLRLKRRVDRVVDAMLEEAFADVEAAVAEEFGYGHVSFSYDTKLVMPARLALGYCYRTLPDGDHGRAEALTRLAVEALVDGDMRDALNDGEFEDFEVDFETDRADRKRIAATAQEVLQARVEAQFADYPAAVREAYDWAVGVSERHQAADAGFRDLMQQAQDGAEGARERIRREYKHAAFEEQPELFTEVELSLPYIKTQYDRVGVIYDGMIRMYRSADLPVADSFHRSIVLAITGAQLWLDDIDDYEADMREGQLTPVTAEYLLAEDDASAARTVVEVSETYLDRAQADATAADSTLTSIATEYIRLSGTPEVLPGWERRNR